MKTNHIYYQTHFEILFNSTFDTFQILHNFHSKVLGKLERVKSSIKQT